MSDPVHYAHTLEGRPRSDWEPLSHHLAAVAKLAGEFAAAFGAADWGRTLGRWHDLGKYSAEFQRYLDGGDADAGEDDGVPGRVDHSTFGAQHAVAAVGGHLGQLLAFCIAGHHGSLPDAAGEDEGGQASSLRARLKKRVPAADVPPDLRPAPALRLPFRPDPNDNPGFQVAFLTRMLFSALIDADRTATEAFCDPPRSAERSVPTPAVSELAAALDGFLRQKQAGAEPTPVNRTRAGVLADCRAAAPLPPGFFSLNVPTGGGKTYSSLAFALRHAEAHGLRRVVVAIPFTSIIEQTADAYRKALGALADHGLVEHHSNVEPGRNTRRNKLAAENWDAPLVVSTNVQLYESLFAARGTPCRKLHRLAGSVIVLDEAQTIPVELLLPTLEALKELVRHYGCSVVLCTATQPALERRAGEFEIGIDPALVRPIIRDVPALFAALRRVEVEHLGRLSDDELADRLAAEPAALCVVNSRPHAAKLYDAVVARAGAEGCYHLSTFMCAQHRRDTLATIRQRLNGRQPCRLVSTQLIEAGVDVDFPAVYRAPAGFDSVAQAAGRCNREGLLPSGRVYVFDTASPVPPGLLRAAAQCGRELFGRHPDVLAPDAVEAYFRLFYWSQKHQWDRHDVLGALADDFRDKDVRLKFRTAASRYKIIRDEQRPILVPYDDRARTLRDRLMAGEPADFITLRAAQRYIVGVRDDLLHALSDAGVLVGHESGLWLLANEQAYSRVTGLTPGNVGMDPGLLCL